MENFDLLAAPGNIGNYQSCRVTLLLLHEKATQTNTLCFGRFCMQSSPVSLPMGEPRERENLFDGYSCGILEYDISVDEARATYKALVEGTWKDPAGRDLVVEPTLEKLERKYTGPAASYRENNFLTVNPNGSHWIEFFNQAKQTVQSIYPPTMMDGLIFSRQETRRKKVMVWIDKMATITKINFHEAQDRIGNIIFQFPVTILKSEMQSFTEDKGYPLAFTWENKQALVKPVFIIAQSLEENSLVDQEILTYNGEDLQYIPIRLTDTSLRIRVVRQSPNLVLYEWNCDCGQITNIYGTFTRDRPTTRTFMTENCSETIELSFPNQAFNPLHHLEHSKTAINKVTKTPSYCSFESGQREESLKYVRKLITETRSPEILLIDPYLRCIDIMNTLYFSRLFDRPIRVIGDCGEETEEEKRAMAKMISNAATPPNKPQWRMDKERNAFKMSPSPTHNGMKLEVRMRIDGLGFPFHDRFLMFPGSAKDGIPPLVYSLGTSLNSLGEQYHVIVPIEHPYEIIEMFNRQWEALNSPQCLVFKHP